MQEGDVWVLQTPISSIRVTKSERVETSEGGKLRFQTGSL